MYDVMVRVALMTTAYVLASVAAQACAQAAPQSAEAAATSRRIDAAADAPGAIAEEDAAATDVVVTARRRGERLLDVPVAVTAINGDDLTRLQIVQTSDLVRVTPGLVIQPSVYGSSNLAPTIRSQRQALTNGTYDASVGVYFAEVPQARTHGLNAGLFDLDSVQVLKGPQGTLFGRNSTGGALLLTPKAPGRDLGGYVTGTLGNYDLRDIEGALNLPLGDRLQLRFAGKVTRRDGYIADRTLGRSIDDQHTDSWRASARWEIATGLDNTLVLNGFDERDEGLPWKLIAFRPGTFVDLRQTNLAEQLAYTQGDFYRSTNFMRANGTDIHTFGLSNITTLEVGSATIKNIFGYRFVRSDLVSNATGSGSPNSLAGTYQIENIERGRQYSDELNISGKALGGSLDYIAGLFYFRENNHSYQLIDNYLGPSVTRAFVDATPTNQSYSAYSQVSYSLPFYAPVSVTGGIRFNHDDRRVVWRSRNVLPASTCRLTAGVPLAPINPCLRDSTTSFEEPTYNLSIDWKPNSRTLVYLAHRHGYRSGGYTFTANSDIEARPYLPEIVDDIELGTKAQVRVFGTPLRANLALYYQNYRNIQRMVTDTSQATVRTTVINAASAKIRGLEFDAGWNPTPRVEISGSFAYSRARYDSFLVAGAGGTMVDYTDSEFAGAPEYTATGLIRYHLPLPERFGAVHVQASAFYLSHTVAVDATSFDLVARRTRPTSIIPGRTIFDGRVEWQVSDSVQLAVWGRNLFEKKYYNVLQDVLAANTFGFLAGLPGAPRTIGAEASFRF